MDATTTAWFSRISTYASNGLAETGLGSTTNEAPDDATPNAPWPPSVLINIVFVFLFEVKMAHFNSLISFGINKL